MQLAASIRDPLRTEERKDYIVSGGGSSLFCVFGHLLAEVSSLRLVLLVLTVCMCAGVGQNC